MLAFRLSSKNQDLSSDWIFLLFAFFRSFMAMFSWRVFSEELQLSGE